MFLPRPSMTGLFSTAPGEGAKSRRALLLLGVMLLYLTLGAALFSAFEYAQDMRARADIAKKRRLMQRKYNFTVRDFALLERVVVQSIPFAAGAQWQFLGALYFCTVVITTIGYGHSTPITVGGKMFCMLYALGGIPLGLVMFQSVGERINHFIGLALRIIGRWLKRRRDIDWLVHVKSRHLLCISFAIGCVTISVATGVFHQRERWTVFDAAYYCMITLSTIGFGDLVPAQTDQRLLNEPVYVLFTLFFILFGLAIFSACINLLILECMAYNADMVTARTRLKRMLSARISTSFRIVTGGIRQTKHKQAEQITLSRRQRSVCVAFAARQRRHGVAADEPRTRSDATRVRDSQTQMRLQQQRHFCKWTAAAASGGGWRTQARRRR